MTLPAPYYRDDDNGIVLYCGDCLDILPELEPGSVDAVVTDPPYGIGYSTGRGSALWGDGSIAGDHSSECRDAALKHCNGLPSLVFGTWKVSKPEGTRMTLVWDTLGALGMGDLALPWKPSHQEIYVLGNRLGFSGERGSDVIRCPPVQSMAKNGRIHPFEKPVELIERLIGWIVAKTICDPFMGSGTTGVACLRTGRRFIGIEIAERYCEIAANRLRKERDRTVLFDQAERKRQCEFLEPEL